MAGKKDLDFENIDDFDFDIPDISIEGVADDRKPVRKIATSFLSGVKSDITDKADLARKLRRVMPEEYDDAINLADDVLTTGSDLYHTVINESRSGIADFKRASRKILGKVGDKLPPKLLKKLEKLVEEDASYSSASKEQIRDDEIGNKLAEIFNTQVEAQNEFNNRAAERDTLKETLANKRHEGMVAQLFGIRQEVHRQVKYQDEITARYQKKSLELQYRQLFVSQDMLALSEKGMTDVKIALQSIVKNTSLPEYRKIELTEAGGQALRERFIRGIQNSFVQYASGFWARSKQNLINAVKTRTQTLNQELGSLASGVSMGVDMPIDPLETGGQTAGSLTSNFLLDRVSPHVRRLLEKNKGVSQAGAKVARTARDLPRKLNEWAAEDSGYGLGGGIKRFFQEVIGVQGLDNILTTNRIGDSEKTAYFDKLTRRSIVEIIPGYLSRIHHEIYALRTGDDDPKGRVIYNLTKGSFETQSTVGTSIRDNIFRQTDFESTSTRLNKLYEIVDPEGKLSNEARNALGEQLLKDTFSGLEFKAERYAQEGYYKEDISKDIAKQIADHFSERFGVEESMDEQGNLVYTKKADFDNDIALNQISDNFHRLLVDTNDPIHQIQAYMQTGHRDILVDLGLIYHKKGRDYVDYDKVWKIYTSGGFDKINQAIEKATDPTTPPSNGGGFGSTPSVENKKKGLQDIPIKVEPFGANRGLADNTDMSVDETGRTPWLDKIKNGTSKTSSEITSGFNKATDFMQPRFKRFGGFTQKVKNDVTQNANKYVGGRLSKFRTDFLSSYRNYSDQLMGYGRDLRSRSFGSFPDTFTGLKVDNDQIKEITENVKTNIKTGYKTGKEEIEKTKDKIIDKVSELVSKVDSKELKETAGAKLNQSKEFLESQYGKGKGVIESLLEYGSDAKNNISNRLGSFKGEVVPTLVETFRNTQNKLNETLASIRERLSGPKGEPSEDTKAIIEAVEKQEGPTDVNNQQLEILARISEDVSAIALMMSKGDTGLLGGLKKMARGTLGVFGKIGRGFGSFYTGYLKMLGGGLSGIGGLLRGGGRAGGNLLSRLFRGGKGRFLEVQDVYLKGNDEPILRASELEKGGYFDSITNKAITKLSDLAKLQGDILDRDGNLVATAKELSRGLYDRFGDKIDFSGAGGILKRGFNALMGFYGTMFKPLGLAKTAAVAMFNTAKDFIKRPIDIYVKGEDYPRLLANVLKNGGYVSSVTGRPIYNVDEINGDVLDRAGNVVLSLDDMRKGLVDRNGRPLGFFARQLSRIVSLAKLPIKALRFGLNKTRELAEKGAGLIGGLFGKKFNIPSLGMMTSEDKEVFKNQLNVLTEIRDLVKTRLPEKNRWDADGSGFRDGSWQEKFAKAKQDKENATLTGTTGKGSSKSGGGLLAGLAALIPGLGGKKKNNAEGSEESEGGGLTDDMSLADAWAAGSVGKWALGKLGKVGRGAGKLLGGAGRLLGRGAVGVAGRVGLTALAGKLGLGALLAKGAGVAAAVLSLPALVTAAAVGAVAVGGYLAYKHFTKAVFETFGKLRMLQYGVGIENEDNLAKILYLEEQLLPHTTVVGGKVEFDMSSVDPKELLKGFGIEVTDNQHVEAFTEWFIKRFLPVFKTHVGTVKSISEDYTLKRIDKQLEPTEKAKYVEGARNVSLYATETPPYQVMRSPFDPYAALSVSTYQIEEAFAEAAKAASEATKPENVKPSMFDKLKDIGRGIFDRTAIGFAFKTSKAAVDVMTGKVDKEEKSIASNATTPTSTETTKPATPARSYANTQNANYHSSNFISAGAVVQHPGNGSGGNVNDLPLPKGDGSWDAHKELIVAASAMAGVDPGLMAAKGAIESGFRSNIKASTSSASGLFQFISSTWKRMLSKYGSKYGIAPNTPPTDPRANALMAAEYLKENEKELTKVIDRPLTDADFYAAHFMGAGGAKKLLTANPNENAVKLFPSEARANKPIFFSNGAPRTVAGVYSELDRRIGRFRDTYGAEARAMAGDSAFEFTNAANAKLTLAEVTTPSSTPSNLIKTSDSKSIRASITSSSIDSSVGINENINRDVDKITDRREKERSVAIVKDAIEHKRQEQMSSNMSTLVDILNKSLQTQVSMDSKLKDVVDILRSESAKGNQVNKQPEVPKQEPPYKYAASRQSEGIGKAVVNLKRQRSI